MTMNAEGSTLLELIVVLAIVALLFGVALPALSAVPGPIPGAATDSVRQAAVRTGVMQVGDSIVALPDGRELSRGGPHER